MDGFLAFGVVSKIQYGVADVGGVRSLARSTTEVRRWAAACIPCPVFSETDTSASFDMLADTGSSSHC
jgi:hypothetical protein